MCGRFALFIDLNTLIKHFGISFNDSSPAIVPRYNIAPTQQVLGICKNADGLRRIRTFRWGLIPHWAKEASIGNRLINARCETAHEKPFFRNALRYRRCLIPSSGFFEWLRHESRTCDCLADHPARPAVPSAVPYEVGRRGNKSSKSPRTMKLAVDKDGYLNREEKVFLPASRRIEARVDGMVSKCESL